MKIATVRLLFCAVLLQIGDGKIEVFPVLQARCLETEEDETVKQLEALSVMVTSVLERFKEEVCIYTVLNDRKCKVCIISFCVGA